MGSDIQRTILLVFFGFSLFLLWNNWQVYNGKPPMFGPAPAPKTVDAPAVAPSAPVPDAIPSSSAVPSSASVPQGSSATPNPAATAVDATPGAPTLKPVVVQTDLTRTSIDPTGAVVARVELLRQPVAPDWTASGLVGLVTGKRHDADATTVLLEVGPNRFYVAQSGIIGGEFPNHRTPFKFVEGPTELREGQDHLDVRFAAEAG